MCTLQGKLIQEYTAPHTGPYLANSATKNYRNTSNCAPSSLDPILICPASFQVRRIKGLGMRLIVLPNWFNKRLDSPIDVSIREKVSGCLEEVVPEEETSEGMLHTTTHLNQVLQDISTRALFRLDVHNPHCH